MEWAIPNVALSATLYIAFRLRDPARVCSRESLNSGDAHQYTTFNPRTFNLHILIPDNWCFFNVLWYENVPKISNETANINIKTIQLLTATSWVTHRKQQKSKKVILLNNTLTFGDVLLGNITFFDFCCFRCVSHDVVVNTCINCSSFYIYTYK